MAKTLALVSPAVKLDTYAIGAMGSLEDARYRAVARGSLSPRPCEPRSRRASVTYPNPRRMAVA